MSDRALLFTHQGQTLAVPARLGREAFVPHHLLPLPAAHAALLGLTEVRGRSVPLIDLAALTGTAAPEHSVAPTLALLLEVNGDLLALPVQQVLGVVSAEHWPDSPNLLSEPFFAGTHSVRALDITALTATVRSRLDLT